MHLTFFSPVTPASAKIRSYKSRYGLVAEPVIDAAFYFDLVVKSLAAVQVMKDGNTWPAIHHSKCNDSSSSVPLQRNIDLQGAMEVTNIIHFITEIFSSSSDSNFCLFRDGETHKMGHKN